MRLNKVLLYFCPLHILLIAFFPALSQADPVYRFYDSSTGVSLGMLTA